MAKYGLPVQQVVVDMFKGLDTKTDIKLTDKFPVNENVRYPKGGRTAKRFGFKALSTLIEGRDPLLPDANLTSGVDLFEFEGELLQISNNRLYSYLTTSETWAERGNINSFNVEQTPVIRNNKSQYNPSFAQFEGLTVRAWQEDDGVYYNITSGEAKVVTEQLISSTAVNPIVKANNNFIHIYYIENTILKVRVIPFSAPTTPTTVTITSDVDPNSQIMDVSSYSIQDFVVCYKRTGDIRLLFVSLYGVVGTLGSSRPTPQTIARTLVNNIKVTIDREGEEDRTIVNTTNTSNQLNVDVFNELLQNTRSETLATGAAIDRMSVIKRPTGTNEYIVFWDESVSSISTSIVKTLSFNLAGTITVAAKTIQDNVRLMSQPFTIGEAILINTIYIGFDDPVLGIPLQTTNFIIGEDGAIELKVNYGDSLRPPGQTTLPSFAVIDANNIELPLVVVDKTTLSTSTDSTANLEAGGPQTISAFTSPGIHSLAVRSADRFSATTAEHAGVLFINSGNTDYYDGLNVIEAGFNIYPEMETSSFADSSGAGDLPAGVRPYRVTYDFINNKGRVERSFPSTIVEHSNAINKNVEITVPNLKLTKKENVMIRVWRAQATTGINYHLVAEATNGTGATTTLTDSVLDTDLLSREFLYTTGGILPNEGFPSSSLGAASEERFWFQVSDKPNTLGYTKLVEMNLQLNGIVN